MPPCVALRHTVACSGSLDVTLCCLRPKLLHQGFYGAFESRKAVIVKKGKKHGGGGFYREKYYHSNL